MIIPFKFRYYDTVFNCFCYSDEFEFENDSEQIIAFFTKVKMFSVEVDIGFTLDGIDIYTNDIVERPHGRHGVVKFTKGVFGLIWEEDYFESNDPDYKKGMMYGSWGQEHNLRKLDDGIEIKVVGNTYQNMDLIKKIKE